MSRRLLSGVGALVLASFLNPLGALAQECTMNEVFIVNLSQDEIDIDDGLTCNSLATDAAIRSCIAAEIAEALPPGCNRRFDIFVPGTKAEHGAWKQFNHLFRTNSNRAKLSLRYEDVREIEGALGLFDPAKYDQGVADARESLILLIDALQRHFPAQEIRVFGHSKGSHSVALVAPLFRTVAFYAFAQPGRTDRDIDTSSDAIERGKLGRAGYIEKLSENLVGITFRNDEVRDFRGSDGRAPIFVPERWDVPGFIWQDNLGGNPAGSYRIDHHNSYGGDYTDGGNGPNDWRDGKGSVGLNLPYCATGTQSAWSKSECSERQVRQLPYFWGTPECEAEAYRMMARGAVGDRYDIGYSGPREPGSCHQANPILEASWRMRFRWNLPDQDCDFKLRFRFREIPSNRLTGEFVVTGNTGNDSEWIVEDGTAFVPIHMRLEVQAKLVYVNRSTILPSCASLLESEAFLDWLELSFTHPATGEAIQRTVIGLNEGAGAIGDLHRSNNVAWEQPDHGSEDFTLFFDPVFENSLKFDGPTEAGNVGNFRKRVHLIE